MKMTDGRHTRLLAIVLVALCGASGLTLNAVSSKEMEQARATAALWYLRYANNGSDYLEKLSPESVGELEKSLKAKEKENIKAFKAVKIPSDYAAWDKEKLVEYWSVTFFKSPGLDEKGIVARSRVRKKVQAMSVAAPVSTAKQSAEDAPKEDPPAPELPESAPASGAGTEPVAALPSGSEVIEDMQRQEDSLMAVAGDAAAQDSASKKKSGSSSTWIYVLALGVLVGIVVWLVIFASRTMQNQSSRKTDEDLPRDEEDEETPLVAGGGAMSVPEEEEEPVVVAPQLKNESSIREKYVRNIASKEEKIIALNREIHDLRDDNLRLREENSRLASDVNKLERANADLQSRLRDALAGATSDRDAGESRRSGSDARRVEPVEVQSREETNEIYLGRVNSKGLFVRADRRPVEGKTMYILRTQDGFTGSYRLLQKPFVIEAGLENPRHYLSGGCVAVDIDDTDGARSIRTLSAGTAVFEDGCWRVLRKSKIAYE